MNKDDGYILLLVLVIVCLITFATIAITSRTTQASYLAAKRASVIPAFSLAESAALEGFWYLVNDPTCRMNQERHWGNTWYRFTIIDLTPGTDDYDLEVLGEGYTGNQQRKVRLVLHRPDLSSDFTISLWSEDN